MFDVAFVGKQQEEVQADWLKSRYHEPSDDLNQPVDKATAGKFEEIVSRLVLQLADTPAKPAWKQSSFFRSIREVTTTRGKFYYLEGRTRRVRTISIPSATNESRSNPNVARPRAPRRKATGVVPSASKAGR